MVDYFSKSFSAVVVCGRVNAHVLLKRQRDGLTEIPNRNAFDAKLAEEWGRGLRYGRSLAPLLIDIDYFKAYNDCFGHLGRDERLRKVAKALVDALPRATDFVGRYGGEEFACGLSETDIEGARHVGERMCTAVRDLDLPSPQSAASSIVSINVGVAACMPRSSEHVENLIGRADQALYEAKRIGRNKVQASSSLLLPSRLVG